LADREGLKRTLYDMQHPHQATPGMRAESATEATRIRAAPDMPGHFARCGRWGSLSWAWPVVRWSLWSDGLNIGCSVHL